MFLIAVLLSLELDIFLRYLSSKLFYNKSFLKVISIFVKYIYYICVYTCIYLMYSLAHKYTGNFLILKSYWKLISIINSQCQSWFYMCIYYIIWIVISTWLGWGMPTQVVNIVSGCVCQEVFYRDLNWKPELRRTSPPIQMGTIYFVEAREELRGARWSHSVSHCAGMSLTCDHTLSLTELGYPSPVITLCLSLSWDVPHLPSCSSIVEARGELRGARWSHSVSHWAGMSLTCPHVAASYVVQRSWSSTLWPSLSWTRTEAITSLVLGSSDSYSDLPPGPQVLRPLFGLELKHWLYWAPSLQTAVPEPS